MSHDHPVHVPAPGEFKPSQNLKTICAVFMFLGILALVFGAFSQPARIWLSTLTSFYYFMSISIVSLFFISLQYITHAGWVVNVRRVFESMTNFIPIGFVVAIVIALLGGSHLYHWMDAEHVAHDAILTHKKAYLNVPFFIIRTVIFFVGWMLFKKVIVGWSVKQDESKDESITLKLIPKSVMFIIFFALSFSLFSVDFVMSLEPHWFSTIFGVYGLSAGLQAGLAFAIILTVFLMKKGLLKGLVNENHLHDLGKYLFGFTVFWAYIAFSQFMLIWYANLPEETIFYQHRMEGAWAQVGLFLILFKFIVPFLALLTRKAKRSPYFLVAVSVLVLVMHYVDLYFIIYPNIFKTSVPFSLWEILIFVGFLGAFLGSCLSFLSKNPLVPVGDPRIKESTSHHVTY